MTAAANGALLGPAELGDVQDNILRGHRHRHAEHLFLRAATAGAARELLGRTGGRVSSAAGPGSPTVNLALTYAGLCALGVPDRWLAQLPVAFREGPRHRAHALGDVGPSDPECWDTPLGTDAVHVLLSVRGKTTDELAQEVTALRGVVAGIDGVETVHEERSDVLLGPEHGPSDQPVAEEHFGFADGFAQPDVEGVDPGPRSNAISRGGGVPAKDGGWRPVRLGEFLLGHPDEDRETNESPDPRLTRNGTYLVFRKLEQRVARFRDWLAESSRRTGLAEELVAAKVVGRWRDGTPLSLDPDHGQPASLADQAVDDPPNDFRFHPHDRDGRICPRGAHIRRANPRDALDFGGGVIPDPGRLTARHRIIRRGMPYGAALPEGAPDDGASRGLHFLCFNADIERQFETIQAVWCMDGDAFGLGDDRDLVLGPSGGSGTMTIPLPDGRPAYVDGDPELVVTRGAEYLFVPSLTAIGLLARGVG